MIIRNIALSNKKITFLKKKFKNFARCACAFYLLIRAWCAENLPMYPVRLITIIRKFRVGLLKNKNKNTVFEGRQKTNCRVEILRHVFQNNFVLNTLNWNRSESCSFLTISSIHFTFLRYSILHFTQQNQNKSLWSKKYKK